MAKKLITEQYHRISNPKFKDECASELRTINIKEDRGIKALFCDSSKQVKVYLFDKSEWTLDEAKEWVETHAKDISMQYTKGAFKIKADDEFYPVVASNEVEDRDGEVVNIKGWDISYYQKNPVVLWMHNRAAGHDGRPVGKAHNIRVEKVGRRKALTMDIEFDDGNEFNRDVKRMVKEGLLNSVSVGFLPHEREGNEFTKQELLEVSVVPVPSNREAIFLREAKMKGISAKKAMRVIETKAVVPYRAHLPAPETRGWDASATIKRVMKWAGGPRKEDVRWNDFKEAFTWYDKENGTNVTAYKLPHHDVEGSTIVTVWRGVATAMAALLGARGGVDIPEADKRKVYNHLVKHYKQFDKPAPEYRSVETQEMKELFDLIKDDSYEMARKETIADIKAIRQGIRDYRKQQKRANEDKQKAQQELVNKVVKALKLKFDNKLEDHRSQNNN